MSATLREITSDGWLLFATRSIRLFAYGGLSVVLVLYLVSIGLTESEVGLLLTATLLGDTLIDLPFQLADKTALRLFLRPCRRAHHHGYCCTNKTQ